MSDADRLSEIRARLNAATPGNWTARLRSPWGEGLAGLRGAEIVTDATVEEVKAYDSKSLFGSPFVAGEILFNGTAEFIAAAPADIAFLLAEVSRLSTVIEEAASVQHAESRELRHREIDLVVEMLTKHDIAQATQGPAYRVGNRHDTAECIWYLLNPERLADSALSVPVSPKEKKDV